MKKILLTLSFTIVSCLSSLAFTADDLCGVYLEKTSGQQALSILCTSYNTVSFSNLVIVSKNASGELEFYGFYKSPNAIKGTFNEADQTITFNKQNVWGSTSYTLCKDANINATIDASTGKITLSQYVISYESDQYCKGMTTTFTKQTEQFSAEGTITATGYFEGNATLKSYGSNRYLLKEGTKMGYTHCITVSSGKATFLWGKVIYSDDPYCYVYNTIEDEDLLMLGTSASSTLKNVNNVITLTTPFKYYNDYSDEQDSKKSPDAQGTYTGVFNVPTAISETTIATSHNNGVAYNLSGQRLSKAQRGINIIDGHKVIIR